jgi:hypothetical protein
MEKHLVKTARFFGSSEGGNIVCTTPDGEIKWTLGVRAQILRGSDLLAFMDHGDELSLEGGVSGIVTTGNRLKSMRSETAFDTGANPDFKPAALSQAELNARKLLQKVQAASKGLDKRMASFEAAMQKSAPAKPAEPADPVIEDPADPAEPTEPAEDPKTGETVEQGA